MGRAETSELEDLMRHHEAYSKKILSEGKVVRRVVCAANRRRDGAIVCSARHNDPRMHVQKALVGGDWEAEEQGFIDQWGVFMDRREAWLVAEAGGQIVREVSTPGVLYSENLY
jgi:hypothetical protein